MPTFLKMSLIVVVMARGAAAQEFFVSESRPYSPLTGGTVLALPSSTATDEAGWELPLPFPFVWYGQTYNNVFVSANGFISFIMPCSIDGGFGTFFAPQSSGICSTYLAPGANGLPHPGKPLGLIAAFYDDLAITGAAEVRVVSNSSRFEVEFSDVPLFNSTNTLSAKIRLLPGGSGEIEYGPTAGSTTSGSGFGGFKDHTGLVGSTILARPGAPGTCDALNQTNCCGYSADAGTSPFLCPLSAVPSNTLFRFPKPVSAELVAGRSSYSNLTTSGGNVAFSVSVEASNIGQQPAADFVWRVALSTDRTFGAGDVVLYTSSPVSLAPDATQTFTANVATTTPLANGQYYVLVTLDSTNVLNELIETNNTSIAGAQITLGLDLLSESVSGPGVASGGLTIPVAVRFSARGTQAPSGAVTARVLMSSNATFEPSDVVLDTFTRALAAEQVVEETLQLVVPNNAPLGDVYLLLQVDPANTIAEQSETNNVVASVGKTTIIRPNMRVISAQLVDPFTGAPTTEVRLGEPGRVVAVVGNASLTPVGSFSMGVAFSTDSNLSLLSDTFVSEQFVDGGIPARMAPDAGDVLRTYTLDFTMPMMAGRPAVSITTGAYYFFVVADSRQEIFETDKSDNSRGLGPLLFTEPGPDLVVGAVTAPAAAGVGEAVPVSRTLRNVGTRDAAQVHYRYYLSANDIITPEDTPLQIINQGAATDFGVVTLARQTANTATELVRLPGSVAPGTYYLGCIIDTDGMVREADETNNGRASTALPVAASSLRVLNSQLPDATFGRSYLVRLAAQGESGPSMWDVEASQGDLPAGLRLDAMTGELSGTPTGTAARVAAFTVRLTNGGRTVSQRVAMRLLPPTSTLEITTDQIPAFVNATSTVVNYRLGVAGGVAPYAWRVSAGALPRSLSLNGEGILVGSPAAGTADGTSMVTFEVRDSAGSVARRQLGVRLVAAEGLVITALPAPVGVVGSQYSYLIGVQNLAPNDRVTATATGLPPGLTFDFEADTGTFGGTPTRAGSYSVNVRIVDSRGRADAIDLVLQVYAAPLRVAGSLPSVLRPGEQTTMTFTVTPASSSTRFTIVAGQVPSGLALDAATGVLSGTVDTAAPDGTSNFVIEAVDSVSQASGLGPFALRTERPPARSGCSTSPFAVSPLVALALALGRRSRKAAAVVASVILVVPTLAFAQLEYSSEGPQPLTGSGYQSLVAGQTGTTVMLGSGSVNIPFAFNFAGTPISSVVMSVNGYLAVGGANVFSSSNTVVPHNASFTANRFIAPWWDSLTTSATAPASAGLWGIRTAPVTGERIAVFEWQNVRPNQTTNPPFSFQAHLYERSGQIRFVYGPAAPTVASASIGVQRDLNLGTSVGGCSPNCTTTSFPANSYFDLFLPAELRPAAVSVDQVGYEGVGLRVAVTVRNEGGRAASNVPVRFYLSTNNVFERATDVRLTPDCVAPLAPASQETTTAACAPAIPSGTAPGAFFVFAEVDPDSQVPEQNEANNVTSPVSITVGMPTPDLSVSGVSAPSMTAPGATVSVMRSLLNVGNAPAAAFKFSYFLSENSVVTISDLFLGAAISAPAGLAPGMPNGGSDMVTIPSDVVPGTYYLGLCVNYDAAMPNAGFLASEITVANNCVTASAATVVTTGSVAVSTSSLPQATQYAPYSLRLQANGGTGTYTWALVSGTLPSGMNLSSAGEVSGAPAATGTSAFEVRVTSGALTATRMLSLIVGQANLPLAIVDQELTSAEFGRAYSTTLVAVGGTPPYQWALKEGTALPPGLALSTDSRIEGRAVETGDATFTAVVRDSMRATAEKVLRLRVVTPTSLAVGTSALQSGVVRREYLQELKAVGGRAPYTWAVTGFQRLPQNATEAPGMRSAMLPIVDEFGLSVMGSFLSGTPRRAGLYALTLQVRDSMGAEDTASLVLTIGYPEPLAVTTTTLPDSFTGQNYEVRLSHNANRDVQVRFLPPCAEASGTEEACVCVKQGTAEGAFSCVIPTALEQLPAGLTLAADGKLSGSPTGQPGTYAFLVKAIDGNGRQDVRSLSIRVRNDFAVTRRGCSSTGLALSMLSLASLAGAIRRRRAAR